MRPGIRLLTTLDEAQLRRLEPHVYHLVLTDRPRPGTRRELERAVEADAAPNPYAVMVEPLVGLPSIAGPSALILPRACHVALVSRSPFMNALALAATALSSLGGGPRVVCYASLEAAFAAARRAIGAARRARTAPS